MGNERENNLDFFGISEDALSKINGEETVIQPEVEDVTEVEQPVETEEVEEVPVEVTDETEEVEETVEESTEEVDTEAEEVSDDFGYADVFQKLVDDEIAYYDEDKDYELSEEGLKTLIEDTKKISKEKAITELAENADDDGKAYLEVLQKGGTFKDFLELQEETSFADADLDDPTQQGYLIEDWYSEIGYDQEAINDLLDGMSEDQRRKQAKYAQSKLIENREQKKEEKLKSIEEGRLAKEEEDKRIAAEFKEEILSMRELKGIKVSENQAKKLYDYITVPEADGKTKAQKEITSEDQIMMVLLKMNGYSLDSIKKEISSKQSISLKKKLSNFKDTNAKRSGDTVSRRTNGKTPKIEWNFHKNS